MKRTLALVVLALLITGAALYADDAKVMPSLVGRFYVAPNFSFAPGSYNSNGTYKDYKDGSAKIFNLGFALEFGATDWITAAVQWVPGVTPWSDVKPAAPASFPITAGANTNGVADLFVGAKLQIVGEKAPVVSDMFRACIAPGVIAPFNGPDYEKEAQNVLTGKDATLNNMDNHVFGYGARLYFDYIINEHFFINLYNQTIFYAGKQDLNKQGPTLAGAKTLIPEGIYQMVHAMAIVGGADEATASAQAAAAQAGAEAGLKDAKGTVDYKYKLTFEIEPQFSTPIGDGISFSAGLPINYQFKPAYEYSVSNITETLGPVVNLKSTLLDQLVGKDSHMLSINPNVSIFLMKTFLPLEFKLSYSLPVYGMNAMDTNTVVFQIKAYFKL